MKRCPKCCQQSKDCAGSDQAPRQAPPVKRDRKKGLLIVHTGDGKGKSTAAFGTALRALGHGYRVAMVQFIKGRWQTGEEKAFRKFGKKFELFRFGKGFTWETKNYEEDARAAHQAWRKCLELLRNKKYRLVIFDEINYCMKYNFLDSSEVVKALEKKSSQMHVILTGDGAPSAIVELADLVSETKSIKHPYEKGVMAQAGIEY